jgi:hypothetical protein
MLVVSINVESWKECATTSISSLQERDCIATLHAQGKVNCLYRGRDRQGQLQHLPRAQEERPARTLWGMRCPEEGG